MPTVSTFRGIIISMYYNDHLPPHFHAEYAGRESKIDIEELTEIVNQGDSPSSRLPSRQLKIALGWAACHQQELMDNWELARAQRPLFKIAPTIE